jgi:formylglycine-generating enzyme required for sulfatase activity
MKRTVGLIMAMGLLAAAYGQEPANMVRIAGGTFMMGSPTSEVGRQNHETQHSVTINKPFYIGKYEVTQKEWVEVMGSNPSYFKGDNLPVENVSWYDAIEYCNKRSEKERLTPAYTIDKTRSDGNNNNGYDDNVKWVVTWDRNANGYRLPTEAEWELACRAGTSAPFYTGSDITTNHANYDGDYPYNNNAKGVYREKTWEVGSGTPNPWGLYDMSGNVYEWCWDWYGAYSGTQTDPAGVAGGSYRVGRGGSWVNYAQFVRSAYRGYFTPSFRDFYLGFRLVRR